MFGNASEFDGLGFVVGAQAADLAFERGAFSFHFALELGGLLLSGQLGGLFERMLRHSGGSGQHAVGPDIGVHEVNAPV